MHSHSSERTSGINDRQLRTLMVENGEAKFTKIQTKLIPLLSGAQATRVFPILRQIALHDFRFHPCLFPQIAVIIELDGKLSNVRVAKSPGLGLEKPVLDTLKKWKSNKQNHHRPNKKSCK